MKQLLIALIMLWGTSEAAAATWYVATNGSDANSGSSESPLATPAAAVERAQPFDVVYLRAGQYALTQTLSIRKPGLKIATAPGETTRAALVAGTRMNSPASVIAVYVSGVTIENLEIQGGAFYGIKLDDVDGAQTGQQIIGNYIHHTGRDGIKAQRADDVVIQDNEIGPTGVRDSSNAEGIDMIGSIGATIVGNYIHDITTNGLYVKGGTRGAIVEKNLVVNTGYAGILLGSETDLQFIRGYANNYGDPSNSNPEGYEALDSIARNNIVVNTGGAGVGTIAGFNVQFLNNTLVNVASSIHAGFRAAPNQHGTAPGGAVIFQNNVVVLAPSSTRPLLYTFRFCGVTSDYNVWFSDGGPYNFVFDTAPAPCGTRTFSGLAGATGWQSTGNDLHSKADDPKLDPSNLYRPLEESPVLNAGLAGVVSDDYADIPRLPNGPVDIGAHETADTPPLAPPTAPEALDASAGGKDVVNLSWSDLATTEEGFRVERSADGGRTFAVIAIVPSVTSNPVTYSDTSVAANTTYSYRVAAYNDAGLSPYSNVDTVKTLRK